MVRLPLIDLSTLFKKNRSWLAQKQTSILSAAFIITIANVLSSVTGLIKERLLIDFFFDTEQMRLHYDAFQVAFQIPDLLFQLIILGAVSAAFIPVFKDISKRSGDDAAFKMATAVMNILLLVFVVFGAIVFVFAHPITAWRTGSGFSAEQVAIAAKLTRIMIGAQFFFAISNFFTSMLQSYRQFIVPAITPIFYNLGIVLGAFLLKDTLGIEAAAYGVVLGAFLHMLLQLPSAVQLGWKWQPSFNIRIPGVLQLFKLMPPRVLTYGLTQFQELGLGFLATSLTAGLGYSTIKLATRLMTLPIRFFGVAIGQAALPFLSEENEIKSRDKFRALLLQSLHQITYLTLPASVLLLILRVPIVRLVYGAGNVPWQTTLDIGKVLAIIALSIAAQASVQLIIRGFHALQDTKTPLYITICTVCIYLSIATTFVFGFDGRYGLLGIALATTVAAFIEFFLFLFFINRTIGSIFQKALFVPQLKMYAAGFLMAVFLYLPFRILDEVVFDTSRTIELIALTMSTSTIGMIAYVYFSALFNIQELSLFTKAFDSFNKWQWFATHTDEVIIDASGDDEGL